MAVKKETVRGGWREVTGIVLLVVAGLLLAALWSYDWRDISHLRSPPNNPPHNYIGPVGAWAGFAMLMTCGLAAWLLPPVLAYLGLLAVFQREGRVWPKALWSILVLASACALVELHPGLWSAPCERFNLAAFPGGVTGDLVAARGLGQWLGTGGGTLAALVLLLVGVLMMAGVHPSIAGQWVSGAGRKALERYKSWRTARQDRIEQLAEEEREVAKQRRKLEQAIKQQGPEPAKVSTRKRAFEDAAAVPAREKAPAGLVTLDDEDPPAPAVLPAKPAVIPRKSAAAPMPASVVEEAAEPRPAAGPVTGGLSAIYSKLRRQPDGDKPAEPAPAPVAKPPPVLRLPDPPKPRPQTTPAAPDTVPASVAPVQPNTWTMPTLALLDPLPSEASRDLGPADFSGAALILKETMAEFGIEVDVTNVERGPVVTRYELLPAPGVRVEKISALSNNIALAMKAESIRVQAPIPGKGVVGIEVPNPKTTAVYLREIMESPVWQSGKAALPLALGKDVGGHVLVADLAEMPHMLVAGATGSGKTVCMNSILSGLLAARTPDQMKLMLVDPKIVEFAAYNNLPHLVVPVVTDAKKVALGLRWAINEMEKRYKLFAKVGVRNIKGFNSRPIVKQEELFPAGGEGEAGAPPRPPPVSAEDRVPDRLPYLVIVIDELADLMLVAQADIENSIARLAQLSRAVGIHMIIATQRPSVNVITGTIKANFPARIAFQVASKVDSRTILDTVGAEKLLGKGDMLFLPPGSSKLLRAQGTYTSDGENHRIIESWKTQGQPAFESAIKDKIEGKQVDLPDMEEDDELLEQSMEIIRQTRRASTSSLQRRLRIGYTRAARIMDLLEQKGIVGPAQGSDPREILIDLDGEVPQNAEQPEQTP